MFRVTQLATFLFLLLIGSPVALASESPGEGVAPSAAKLIDLGGGWAITNSMVTGWVFSALLVIMVLWLIGRPSVLPTMGQAVVEAIF